MSRASIQCDATKTCIILTGSTRPWEMNIHKQMKPLLFLILSPLTPVRGPRTNTISDLIVKKMSSRLILKQFRNLIYWNSFQLRSGISILIRNSTKAVVSLNANDVLLNLISLYFLSDFLIWFLPTESLLVCPWQRVCFDIVIMNVYDLLWLSHIFTSLHTGSYFTAISWMTYDDL